MRLLCAFLAVAAVPAGAAAESVPQLKFLGELKDARPHICSNIAFSPDGKLLAVSDYEVDLIQEDGKHHAGHSLIQLWDVDRRQVAATLRGHTDAVLGLVFSRDGKTLVSVTDGGRELKIWDVTTAKEKPGLKIDPRWCFVALSPDGKTIACANIENHRLNLWETATGKEKVAAEKATVSLKGYSSLRGAAAMNRDGTVWAEAGGHYGSEGLPGAGEVKLWDVTTGRERATFKGAVKLKVSLHQLSYLHKGEGVPKRVLLKVANLNGMEFQTDDVDKELRQALEKILDKNQRDKYLEVLLRQLGTTSHEGPEVVRSVAFSPDGKTLASASVLGTVLLWDVKSGKRVGTFQRFNPSGRDEDLNPAYCVSFSPDGKTLAAGTMHGIKLWDVESGQRLVAVSDPPGAVWSVAFSPDGKRVATSGSKRLLVPKNDIGADPTVLLWEWLRISKADR